LTTATDIRALYDRALQAVAERRSDDAIRLLEGALALAPGEASIFNNLGLALLEAGRPTDAALRLRQALMLRPDLAETHSNLIFALDADPAGDAASQQAERRRWAARHAARVAKAPAPHGQTRDPERRLRVGYVSADFCRHSAAAIFAPIVTGHDPSRIDVVCYSATREVDEATESFRRKAGLWRDIAEADDDKVAETVRADAIDVLVDLSGHSGGGRLLVFARKPAPIQVSAWGHPTGTGLDQIDALFADRVVVPESERRLFAERIEDLPCLLTFEPPPGAPDIRRAGTRGRAPIFGSFNRVAKLSGRVLACWAGIVAATSGARLVLKDAGFDDPGIRARILAALGAGGLAVERVELRGRTDRLAHLAAYNDIDVALDPWPMNGGFTTLEALWMGVPVVALRGRSISGRGCASILSVLGRPDWIAESEADYRARALALMADDAGRAAFAASARERLRATPLADPRRVVDAVEAIYRRLWRDYCASGS
jgi:predicted O-linked N-acetylglucosamine transferase (SPINDLY family)